MNKTRIIFFGTPEFAVSILQALIDLNCNVVACVSQPDRPVGRKHVITSTPVHALCIEHNIPCIQPEKLSKEVDAVFAYEPELIITCAYGQFVPGTILNYPKYGCINIHPSLLPKFRGGAPIHHAIMASETKTGVSLMQMIQKMDAGKVYAQVELPIGEDETQQELSVRLNHAACQLLKDNLQDYIDGKLPGVEQDESKVTIGNNITKEEEEVHFASEDIHKIYDHIRALIDWPIAYGVLDGKRIKFHKVRKQVCEVTQKAGEIIGFKDHALEVACIGGILKIYELQMEGKKKMDADAFKNGYASEVTGKVFE